MRRNANAAWSDSGSSSALMEHLIEFEGPPDEFLVHLLAAQCQLAEAEGGAIFRLGPDARAEAVAIYPPLQEDTTSPVWLAVASESIPRIAKERRTILAPLRGPEELYGQRSKHHLLLIPIRGKGTVRGAASFVLEVADPRDVEARRERLEMSIQLLGLYEMRLTLECRDEDLRQLQTSMEMMSVINQEARFVGAAMSFCNEVASRWRCQRVGLGVLSGRYVFLRGLSHTEKFDRKTQLVQDLESVMEECLDQDLEVLHPAAPDASYIHRAAAQLSARHGPVNICSMPLRKKADPAAVVTLERPPDEPFHVDELQVLRLTCDLCSARLLELSENDRWIGARAASCVRRGFAAILGPTHTWAKVAAIAVVGFVLFLTFVKGDYRAEASFVIEPTTKQIVPSPFDGYLEQVFVRIGDRVEANITVLATLDTSELRLELASARAEEAAHLKRASIANRKGEAAEAQIAEAEAGKIKAQIDLLVHKIEQASIRCTIGGVIVSGDLERRLGAPLRTGDILFEVTPLESLRAELAVPEDQIPDVRVNQIGALATASFPGDKIPFTVERINPMAETAGRRNEFKVFARLDETRDWLRPGMAGTAKITIDKRSYGWIWTRKLVNWVRMKLWL